MSALITGMVLERFPARDLAHFTVALVLADAADHDGGNVYPSMTRIGALSRTSERHARRIVGFLVEMGFIIQESPGGGRGNTARYRIDLRWLQAQESVLGEEKEKGDTVSGFSKTRTPQANQDTATTGFERETRTKPGQNPDTAMSGDPRPGTHKNIEGARAGFVLPDWVPASTWSEFEDFRTEIGKPLTPTSRTAVLRELGRLRGEGHDPQAVIEQSVLRGWHGPYPLRRQGQSAGARRNGQRGAARPSSVHDERAATLAALTGGIHGGNRNDDIIDL